MGVDVQGDTNTAVPEELLGDLGMCAVGQQWGCHAVRQINQTEAALLSREVQSELPRVPWEDADQETFAVLTTGSGCMPRLASAPEEQEIWSRLLSQLSPRPREDHPHGAPNTPQRAPFGRTGEAPHDATRTATGALPSSRP